jgi:hypothetical protein
MQGHGVPCPGSKAARKKQKIERPMMKPKRKGEQGYPRWFYGLCIFGAVLFASLFYVDTSRKPLPDASPTPNLDYLQPLIESALGESRAEIPEDVTDEILMPVQVGDFTLKGKTELSVSDDEFIGRGYYPSSEGYDITLSLLRPQGRDFDDIYLWNAEFRQFFCGEIMGEVTGNKDWRYPYRYGRCGVGRDFIHEITWRNDGWIMTISMRSPLQEPQILLSFLENYPY